jgi:hypothetical protein
MSISFDSPIKIKIITIGNKTKLFLAKLLSLTRYKTHNNIILILKITPQ